MPQRAVTAIGVAVAAVTLFLCAHHSSWAATESDLLVQRRSSSHPHSVSKDVVRKWHMLSCSHTPKHQSNERACTHVCTDYTQFCLSLNTVSPTYHLQAKATDLARQINVFLAADALNDPAGAQRLCQRNREGE